MTFFQELVDGNSSIASQIMNNFRDTNYGRDLSPKDSDGNDNPSILDVGTDTNRWLNAFLSGALDVKSGESLGTRLTADVLAFFEGSGDTNLQFLNGPSNDLTWFFSTQFNTKAFTMLFEHDDVSVNNQRWSLSVFEAQTTNTETDLDDLVYALTVSKESMVYSVTNSLIENNGLSGDYIEFIMSGGGNFTNLHNNTVIGSRNNASIIVADPDVGPIVASSSEINAGNNDYFFRAGFDTDTKHFCIFRSSLDKFGFGLLSGTSTIEEIIRFNSSSIEFLKDVSFDSGNLNAEISASFTTITDLGTVTPFIDDITFLVNDTTTNEVISIEATDKTTPSLRIVNSTALTSGNESSWELFSNIDTSTSYLEGFDENGLFKKAMVRGSVISNPRSINDTSGNITEVTNFNLFADTLTLEAADITPLFNIADLGHDFIAFDLKIVIWAAAAWPLFLGIFVGGTGTDVSLNVYAQVGDISLITESTGTFDIIDTALTVNTRFLDIDRTTRTTEEIAIHFDQSTGDIFLQAKDVDDEQAYVVDFSIQFLETNA